MSKQYEYEGVVHYIGKTQTFPSGFAKRMIVLCEDPTSEYKNYAAFDFIKGKKSDGTKLLDGIVPGCKAKIKFYVKSNESKTKPGNWFPSIQGVGIEVDHSRSEAPNIPMKEDTFMEPEDAGDMPF